MLILGYMSVSPTKIIVPERQGFGLSVLGWDFSTWSKAWHRTSALDSPVTNCVSEPEKVLYKVLTIVRNHPWQLVPQERKGSYSSVELRVPIHPEVLSQGWAFKPVCQLIIINNQLSVQPFVGCYERYQKYVI